MSTAIYQIRRRLQRAQLPSHIRRSGPADWAELERIPVSRCAAFLKEITPSLANPPNSAKMLWTQDKVLHVILLSCFSVYITLLLNYVGLCSCFLVLPLLLLLTVGTYLYLASMEEPTFGKAVLITGCDSGFGNALALHLHRLGFRVFAGCLFADAGGEGAKKLQDVGSDRLHVLQIDVTKQESLDKALVKVKELLPEREMLWGLVNNAGLFTMGPIEWVTMEGFRRVPEVNVFGLIASTKTFLPLIRRSKGRVVNVASVAGRLSVGMMAPYNASKFAVEGFSEALRHEMRSHGVKVSIIEPGNFAAGTNLFIVEDQVEKEVETMWIGISEEMRSEYGEENRQNVERFMKSLRKSGAKDISPVINAFTEALTQTHPQARYMPMDPMMYFLAFVNQHFPEYVFDALYKLLGKLQKLRK